MIDFTTKIGIRAAHRLKEEICIWLTTVDSAGVAQPRPVWFIWDGEAFLVYSQMKAKKLVHIRNHPRATLHFDGGPQGEDIQVFFAHAEILEGRGPDEQAQAYIQKYGEYIIGLGYTADQFFQEYSVPIRLTPVRMRGMV